MTQALNLRHISKRFGANVVLQDVNIVVEAGTLHSIVGENGAGKSTLLNIIHGVYEDYDGEVELFGQVVKFKSPFEAIKAGISKVHQEIQIVPELTVGENIALGSEGPYLSAGLLDRKRLYAQTDSLLERLKCNFRSSVKAGSLTVGDIHMIAIAKSLYHNAKIISFDEPTASMSDRETEVLFDVIRDLLAQGITIIYVSHRLDEVITLSDQISVLRDGAVMGTWRRGELDKSAMIERMVGRELNTLFQATDHPDVTNQPVALSVSGLTSTRFRDIDFELRKGEILGFAGLVGAGRTEVAEAIFGAAPYKAGQVEINGKPVTIKSPIDAMAHGIALIPEDRKRHGFIRNLDNKMNMFVPLFGKRRQYWVDKKKILANFEKYREALQIHPEDPNYMTVQLSGGNQQKIILAKWLGTEADILIFDEPTKGIDVGAKAEIYLLIQALAKDGKAIIVISSELPEILGLSHRILVMHEGHKVVELVNRDLDEKTVLHYAMGVNS